MKTILRTMILEENYGIVGEETNIVDKNGNKLHVGDIVNFVKTFTFGEETPKYVYCQSVIVKLEDFTKAFLMGLERSFNEDGTYEDGLKLELVKSYKDISVGSGYMFSPTILLYEEIDDEE